MKVLKKTGLQHALGALELETGLSKDELKDLTNETDFTQVLNQYKSNADKDSFREAYQARVWKYSSSKLKIYCCSAQKCW